MYHSLLTSFHYRKLCHLQVKMDDPQQQSCSVITLSSDETSKDDDDNDLPCGSNAPSSSTSLVESNFNDISKLQALFAENLSSNQIEVAYKASGSNFILTMECLLKGPTSQSIIKMVNARFSECSTIKVQIDPCEAWEDFVAFYKSPRLDVTKQLRVQITGQPVVDVGGVRAQLYTTVLDSFSQNRRIKLFDGPTRRLRPHYSAQSRSSGLFKVLGTMVGHSLVQDGIGFPFWSPVCYWYMFGSEEQAIQSLTMDDVGNDVAVFLSEVCSIKYNYVQQMAISICVF